MSLNKKKMREQRAEIEDALQIAVERGESVARYRERTGHNGNRPGDKPSFGALKHAENNIQLESVIHRLQSAYDQHRVGSNFFNGALHEYLHLLNATWYQDHTALRQEHREDLVTDLFLKMIDPANSASGASMFKFKGVVPVHRFVNAVFKTFFAEKERKQRDYDFDHFRLVDDSDSTAPNGDIRAGQLDGQTLALPEEPLREENMPLADLKHFGPKGVEFGADFEKRSDVHMVVLALLRQNPDISATAIRQQLSTTRFRMLDAEGGTMKVIEPVDVHMRKVQRIRAAFFDGLREVALKNIPSGIGVRRAARYYAA